LESHIPVIPFHRHWPILAYYLVRLKLMKTPIWLILLLMILSPCAYGQTTQTKNDDELSAPALNHIVAHFDLTDSTIIEGLSKLNSEPIAGLHLGIEVVLRESFYEASQQIRFSLRLEDATVRDILDTLCKFDNRYTWSTDGPSINVYPRDTIGNASYLLNRDCRLNRSMQHPSDQWI
jgi:hypothetical protein